MTTLVYQIVKKEALFEGKSETTSVINRIHFSTASDKVITVELSTAKAWLASTTPKPPANWIEH